VRGGIDQATDIVAILQGPSININLSPLFQIIRGQDIHISSLCPTEIFKILDSININQDTVVLINGDVWRYMDSLEEISKHPKLLTKKVILQHLGYSNTKLHNRLYEISYPIFYWDRITSIDAFVPKNHNLKYGFSCLNNSNNIHRTLLGYKLYTNNLISDMIFSQNLLDPEYTQRVLEDVNALDINLDSYQDYSKSLPIRHSSESHIENFNARHHTPTSINHEAYHNAYCNIVTESECEQYPYHQNINLPVITEKSYKPFSSKQVPLMLAARGHIEYLQGLGFELMTDLLPPGFDSMPVLQKINSIVNIVAQGREFIKDFYFSHLREIQHNYELVNSDKVEKIILQRIERQIYE
jgi:hypothetical protein